MEECSKVAKQALADGFAVVIGLQSTGEATLMQVGWLVRCRCRRYVEWDAPSARGSRQMQIQRVRVLHGTVT